MTVIHQHYYNVLVLLHREGKIKSPFRPRPDSTVALMCIKGWVKRDVPHGDWIELTDTGRELFRTAVAG